MAKVMTDYPKLITCMAPSKTFNLAGLAFSNIIIRSKALRKRFKERDMLSGMVNPLSLTAAKAAYEQGGAWHEALKAYLDENFAFTKTFLAVNCLRQSCTFRKLPIWHGVHGRCLPEVTDLPVSSR